MDNDPKERTLKDAMNLKAIDRRIQDLHVVIDSHFKFMRSVFGQEELWAQTEKSFSGRCLHQSREVILKDVIREAIDVLEESRKAFKSKRLEALRKKLTNALIDTNS